MNYTLGTIPDDVRELLVQAAPTDLKTTYQAGPADAPVPAPYVARSFSPPAGGNPPAGVDPYAAVAASIMQGREAATRALDDQLKAYESYRAESERLRKEGKPTWYDQLVDAIAPIARGFAQTRAKITPGMVAKGITEVDMTSGIDKFMQLRQLEREKAQREMDAKLGRLRDDLNYRGDIAKQRANLFDYDVKAGEYGIRGRERAEDVKSRNDQLAETARHNRAAEGNASASLALQREKMQSDERVAGIRLAASQAQAVQEVAGKYGEESAKNLGETIFKMENDELYKNGTKMQNSAKTVIGMLETAGAAGPNGFAQIGALIQALRSMGDTGVISDSDMRRNIAGSLSAIEAWIAPIVSSGAGGLTKEQISNIRSTMETVIRESGNAVATRREAYRDAFDRTETLRQDAARKVYGDRIPVTRIQGDDLNRAFGLVIKDPPKEAGAPAAPPSPPSPGNTASYDQRVKAMTPEQLAGEIGAWGNLNSDQRKTLEGELRRRGVLK